MSFNGMGEKVITLFFDGRRITLCAVFVGFHESEDGIEYMECSNLFWRGQDTPYREIKTPDGIFKGYYNTHWEAWLIDYNAPIEK